MTRILCSPEGYLVFSHFVFRLCWRFFLSASSSLSILMSPTCFLFMTADDWSTLVLCQRCSRGEHSRTRTNENCHLLRVVQQTSRRWVWMFESVFLGLCVCSFFSLGGTYLILAVAGRKTGQYVGANMCRRYERMQDPLIYPLWRDQWASYLTVQPASAVGRHWVKWVSDGKVFSRTIILDILTCHWCCLMMPSRVWLLMEGYWLCDTNASQSCVNFAWPLWPMWLELTIRYVFNWWPDHFLLMSATTEALLQPQHAVKLLGWLCFSNHWVTCNLAEISSPINKLESPFYSLA